MGRVQTSLGTSLGYEESGAGDATPIVFLHGVGSDKSVWRPQLQYFGRQRRALAFDYPGYGDSDPAPAGTTREDYAAAILSAMRGLGVERAHVCGLSLGGVVAIALDTQAPGRCASLILADTFAVHPDGPAILDRSRTGVETSGLRQMAEGRIDVVLAQPADPAVRGEAIEAMGRIDPTAYLIGAEAVWLADQRERAEAIRVPTLVLVGAEDKVAPPALAGELTNLIPGAREEVIEHSGHLSNLEQSDAFNRLVEGFIRDLG